MTVVRREWLSPALGRPDRHSLVTSPYLFPPFQTSWKSSRKGPKMVKGLQPVRNPAPTHTHTTLCDDCAVSAKLETTRARHHLTIQLTLPPPVNTPARRHAHADARLIQPRHSLSVGRIPRGLLYVKLASQKIPENSGNIPMFGEPRAHALASLATAIAASTPAYLA